MYFPKEDQWMSPDLHIRRLERIEKDMIEHLEKIQDPKLIIKFQKQLNRLLVTKMEWINLKNELERNYV